MVWLTLAPEREGNEGSQSEKKLIELFLPIHIPQGWTDLVPALVPHQHNERPMIFLDIVVDQYWDAIVKLLAHRDSQQQRSRSVISRLVKKMQLKKGPTGT